jgi:hypothetical protein
MESGPYEMVRVTAAACSFPDHQNRAGPRFDSARSMIEGRPCRGQVFVTIANVIQKNGVIHVIDTVLLPKS